MIKLLGKVCFYGISILWVSGIVVQRLWLPYLAVIGILAGVTAIAAGNVLTSLAIAVAGCLVVTLVIALSELHELH